MTNYIISATTSYVHSDDGYCGGNLYTKYTTNAEDAAKEILNIAKQINDETNNVPSFDDNSDELNPLDQKNNYIKLWIYENNQQLDETIQHMKNYIKLFKKYNGCFEEFYNAAYDIQFNIITLQNNKVVSETKYYWIIGLMQM